MPIPPPTDTLLCERCGYDMSSLGLARPCPECGADLKADVAARFAEVRRPRRGWFGLRRSERAGEGDVSVSLFRAGLVVSLSPLAPLLALFAREVSAVPRGGPGRYLLIPAPVDLALLLLGTALVLMSLSIPLIGGFVFFTQFAGFVAAKLASVRGWRLSPASVHHVQARAVVGIDLAALGWALGWIGTAILILTVPAVAGWAGAYIVAFQASVLALGFGTYVVRFALGVRAGRFANPPEVLARHAADTVASRATISYADTTTN